MSSLPSSKPVKVLQLGSPLSSPDKSDLEQLSLSPKGFSSPKLVPLSPPNFMLSENVPEVTDLIQKNYELAKKRACDLKVLSNSAPTNHKNQIIMACNLYRTTATILYSSLSLAQNRELEKYLEENISNVPSSLYDLSEWRSLLDLAQSMRLEETKRLGDSIYAKEFQFFKESNEQIRADFLVECADIRASLQNFQTKIIPAMQENKAKHQSAIQKLESRIRNDYMKITTLQKAREDERRAHEEERRAHEETKRAHEEAQRAHEQHIVELTVKYDQQQQLAIAQLEHRNKEILDKIIAEHTHAHNEQKSYYDTRVSELNEVYIVKMNELNVSNEASKQAEINMLRVEFEETMKEQREVLQASHGDAMRSLEKSHATEIAGLEAKIAGLEKNIVGLEAKTAGLEAKTALLASDDERLRVDNEKQVSVIDEQAREIKRLTELLTMTPATVATATKFSLSMSELAEMRKSFAEIDQNGDGKITRNELKEMLRRVLDASITDEEVEQMLGLSDRNNDGIDFEEWIAATV